MLFLILNIFRLKVKAEGKPQPKVHWFKDGKELFPSEEFLIDTPEEGVSELTITQVYPDDIGEIVCEAHNELGIATTTTFINLPGIQMNSKLNVKYCFVNIQCIWKSCCKKR